MLVPILGIEHGISSEQIANAWIYFMEDCEVIPPYIKLVSDKDDGGEFKNVDGIHNGRTYIGYQLEEDDEYSNEKIIVLRY